MALKLHYSSLSLSASVDQQTGNLSVFDIIEDIKTPQVPIHLPSLVISLALEKTQPGVASGKLLIHVLTPDGNQAVIGNGDIQMPEEQKRMKAVFRFGGFPLFQFGGHRLVVSWTNAGGTKEGEAIFDFDVIQVTQIAQGTPSSNPQKPPLSH